MGMQNKEGWKNDSRRKEVPGRGIPLQGVVDVDPDARVRKTARTGAVWITLFWLVMLAVTYAGVRYYEDARAARYKPYAVSSSEMVIPRSPDGHFRVDGEINGQAVRFMVDTGASAVTVTEAFAQRAGLHGGQPTTFMTANGPRAGTMLRGVPVLAGTLSAQRVDVGTGLFARSDDEALLGQSFLSQFDVVLRKDHMVIKRRAQ
jgi:aspartyl protease family protein